MGIATWAKRSCAVVVLMLPLGLSAQPVAPAKKPPAAKAAAAVTAAPAAGPSGKGWRTAARPAWVVEPPPQPPGVPQAPNAGARREQLYDVQLNYTLLRPQTFVRQRSVALDASAVGSVSQPQITFNPAFQTVLLHGVAVWRDGKRFERLADTRVEPMRREQRLEQQVIDGAETLLLVLNDVRVGDAVELAYTVEGENPIFEGRISTGVQLAHTLPVDTLHYRLLAPASRPLQLKAVAGEVQAERSEQAGQQTVRVLLHQVAALPTEQQTPPWVKAYPALLVSEWHSWAEIDAWAQRLFAAPAQPHPAITARAEAFRQTGLSGPALASEVLRFVQDDVRYFSVSLGESSHRPKPAQQTLAELLGDCKDKTVLLNALLRELGFDARPALVSVARNRGLGDFPPGHDQFDHVVTALHLEGRRWLVDSTLSSQGLGFASRGQWPYGKVLVVGGGGTLEDAAEPADALNRIEHEQRWDVSALDKPATLQATMRALGLAAERWRAIVAAAGTERVADALAGSYARLAPGLQAAGAAEVHDDRNANVLRLTQRFTHAEFGQYKRGMLEADFAAIELFDALAGPPEPRRRTAFHVDQPRIVESRLSIQTVVPMLARVPQPLEINGRHINFSSRVDVSGSTITFTRRVERKADQVLPTELDAFREQLQKSRVNLSNQLRLALLEPATWKAGSDWVEKEMRDRKLRNDALGRIVAQNRYAVYIDNQVLRRVPPRSGLAAQARASSAQAHNLLGQFDSGHADASAALEIRPQLADAREALAVAQLGQGKAEEALAGFKRLAEDQHPGMAGWTAAVSYHLGRYADAESWARTAAERATGEERDFALIGLYLAAERQGGRGKAAIAPFTASAAPPGNDAPFSATLLQFVQGATDRETMLKRARVKPEFEQLNLAEAYFYIGRQLDTQGQREEALRWYRRVVEIGATPYRETSFAQLELTRAKDGMR